MIKDESKGSNEIINQLIQTLQKKHEVQKRKKVIQV